MFSTLILLLSPVLAAASPAALHRRATPTEFTLQAIEATGNGTAPVGAVYAARSALWVNLPTAADATSDPLRPQDATCEDGEGNNPAIFYLADGELYLYAVADGLWPEQQVYSDRSGMGQGTTGYSTAGVEGTGKPRNAEVSVYDIDKTNDAGLQLNGAGFLACPIGEDVYSVRVDVGIDEPAGQTGCVKVKLAAVEVEELVSCTYTPTSFD